MLEMARIRKRGTFGGSIEANGKTKAVGIQSDEIIDTTTGEVTLNNRSLSRPSIGTKHNIQDRNYARKRAYIVMVERRDANAELYRNRPIVPNPKPARSKRADIVTTNYCVDCDGNGEIDGDLCRACGGKGRP